MITTNAFENIGPTRIIRTDFVNNLCFTGFFYFFIAPPFDFDYGCRPRETLADPETQFRNNFNCALQLKTRTRQ